MNTLCALRLPASPLWQLVHHGWDEFLSNYESKYRKDLGLLHPAAATTVESFLRCGDLASGFSRLQCPDCGHKRLLAFTCIRRRQRLWRTGGAPLLPVLPSAPRPLHQRLDRHRRLPRSAPPPVRVGSFAPGSVGPHGPALRAACLARLPAARLTIPKVLRGIFRKRRQLLTHLFHIRRRGAE